MRAQGREEKSERRGRTGVPLLTLLLAMEFSSRERYIARECDREGERSWERETNREIERDHGREKQIEREIVGERKK